MIGQCKLCKQSPVLLQDSHYIPAAIYRALRDERSTNPNPLIITAKSIYQSSSQKKSKLLCSACENLLSKNGENWALKQILKADGTFKMRSILSSYKPSIFTANSETKVFYANEIPEIDIAALAYFASSVFWRGSIHEWNEDRTIPVKLGPYGEKFRQYLLGEQEFPKNCYLLIAVREGGDKPGITYPPFGKRDGHIHYYNFPIPGFAFTLIIGKAVSLIHRELCFVTQSTHPIIYTSVLENMLESDFQTLLRNQKNEQS